MTGRERMARDLERGEMIVAPGAHDGITARVIRALGFNGVDLGGFATATALGTIEPLLTMTEQVDLAELLVRATPDLPIIVDGHTGFGNGAHITRMVQECERIGVAAIHIEDQPFPKQLGYHAGLKDLAGIDEMRRRLSTALEARSDPNLKIIARTDARGAQGGSLQETIRRSAIYRDAGADFLMPMPYGVDEAKIVSSELGETPLVWVGGLGKFAPGAEVHLDELKRLGYRLILFGVVGMVTSANAVWALYKGLKETGVVRTDELEPGYERVLEWLDFERMLEIEQKARS